MNCQPGDLAVVVKCDPKPSCIGQILRCVTFVGAERVDGNDHSDVWFVEWGGKTASDWGQKFGMPDSWMKPIRDPGDDAVDEMVALVGTPQGVTA